VKATGGLLVPWCPGWDFGAIKWRWMPGDFPSWDRVYAFSRRRRENGLAKELHDRLRGQVREAQGRQVEPTAAIIDSQSVKAAASVPSALRGYDGGKKINGRRRHVITDCLGLLLVVLVTAATSPTARPPAPGCPGCTSSSPRSSWCGPTAATPAAWLTGVKEKLHLTLQIVNRSDDMTGFVVLPRRWVVERSLGWLLRSRRLARDYETGPTAAKRSSTGRRPCS
jgi:transposase